MDERRRASSRLQPCTYQRSSASSWCRRAAHPGPCARRTSYGTFAFARWVSSSLSYGCAMWSASSSYQWLQARARVEQFVFLAREQDDVRRRGRRGLQPADVAIDQLVVQDVAVHLGERRVAIGEPAQQDHELQQVGVRLLPERLLALAEQVVQQRGDGIGHRVRVEIVVAAGCSRRRCRARSRCSPPPARSAAAWPAPAGRSRPSLPSRARPACGQASWLRQRRSWSTYGYMQADVLPVPTAPRTITPV